MRFLEGADFLGAIEGILQKRDKNTLEHWLRKEGKKRTMHGNA